MMQLLAQFMTQQDSGSAAGIFNVSYSVSGAGTGAANGTYYAMMSPDVKDQWGNPVYMNTNGQTYLFASDKIDGEYFFKISSNYQSVGTDYYYYTGIQPDDINSPENTNGALPFPTIQ